MAQIKATMVKELRDRTGLGMMECKKALTEAGGDIEAAIEEMRKSSGMKAAKKAGRTAAEGAVAVKVADDQSVGVLVEVIRCVGLLTQPFMPDASAKILGQIKVNESERTFVHLSDVNLLSGRIIEKPEGVFPRHQIAEEG